MKTPEKPAEYKMPLRAKRGRISFLRAVMLGASETEQMARFRDFLRWAIPQQKQWERGFAAGVVPPATDAEVEAAVIAYREEGFSAEVLELVLPAVAEWKRHRLRQRAAGGGRAKAAKRRAAEVARQTKQPRKATKPAKSRTKPSKPLDKAKARRNSI